MSKTRSKKQQELERLNGQLSRMKSMVLSTYVGLKVKDATKVRKKLRAEGIEYAVVKKTLLTRALKAANISIPQLESLTGGIALAFGYQDEIAPAKLLDSFRKEHEQITLLSGIVGGVVYDTAQIQALAKLPSKQELLAKIVGTLQRPLAGFVQVAAGPLTGFVRIVRARAEQQRV